MLDQVWSEREGVRNLLNMVGRRRGWRGLCLNRFLNFAKDMKRYIKERNVKFMNKINIEIGSFFYNIKLIYNI